MKRKIRIAIAVVVIIGCLGVVVFTGYIIEELTRQAYCRC